MSCAALFVSLVVLTTPSSVAWRLVPLEGSFESSMVIIWLRLILIYKRNNRGRRIVGLQLSFNVV